MDNVLCVIGFIEAHSGAIMTIVSVIAFLFGASILAKREAACLGFYFGLRLHVEALMENEVMQRWLPNAEGEMAGKAHVFYLHYSDSALYAMYGTDEFAPGLRKELKPYAKRFYRFLLDEKNNINPVGATMKEWDGLIRVFANLCRLLMGEYRENLSLEDEQQKKKSKKRISELYNDLMVAKERVFELVAEERKDMERMLPWRICCRFARRWRRWLLCRLWRRLCL